MKTLVVLAFMCQIHPFHLEKVGWAVDEGAAAVAVQVSNSMGGNYCFLPDGTGEFTIFATPEHKWWWA